MNAVEAFLTEREIPFTRAGDAAWSLSLAGDAKHAIPVGLALSADGVRAESFFMRAPHENAGEVYRMLLARNARARRCWFAVDGLGDIYLLGFSGAGDDVAGELDRLLGELLTVADQMFTACIERGFATYLANDMAWRAKQPRS